MRDGAVGLASDTCAHREKSREGGGGSGRAPTSSQLIPGASMFVPKALLGAGRAAILLAPGPPHLLLAGLGAVGWALSLPRPCSPEATTSSRKLLVLCTVVPPRTILTPGVVRFRLYTVSASS